MEAQLNECKSNLLEATMQVRLLAAEAECTAVLIWHFCNTVLHFLLIEIVLMNHDSI